MDTDSLIRQLASAAPAAARLPSPPKRMAMWLALSAPYVALVVAVHGVPASMMAQFRDWHFVVELAAIASTAITAAIAAFASVIPGHDRRWLLLPLAPFGIWLVCLGEGCLRNWISLGPAGLTLHFDSDCLAPAAVIGIVPAVALILMLRRGAPMVPRVTLALAALAIASLGNAGLRLFHPSDASLMVLVWHFGGTVVIALVAACLGRLVLNWRAVRA